MDPEGTQGAGGADLLPLMVESLRDHAIFLLDPEGFVRTWNSGAERIKGYRADEVIGQNFAVFFPAEEVRAHKPEYELAVAADRGRFEDEGWRIRKDGTAFWANVVITAMRGEDGRLLGYVKVTRDLTERKRAEDERVMLLAAERAARIDAERARTRVEAMQAVTEASLFHTDLSNTITVVLQRVQEALFADAAVMLLREESRLAPLASVGLEDAPGPPGEVTIGEGIVGRIAADATPATFEGSGGGQPEVFGGVWPEAGLGVPLLVDGTVAGVLVVANRGTRRFLAEDVSLLQLLGARAVLAVHHARAIEAERLARAEVIAARNAAKLRADFIAVASHELKTPVATLRLSSQLALRRLLAGDLDRAEGLLNDCVRQVDRLNKLVVQLLDVSRLDAERFQVELAPTDVVALVEDVVRMHGDTADRAITLRAPGELQAEIDPLRFSQVLSNFLDNAVKYGPDDTLPIEVDLVSDGESLEVSVRDHGIGVPVLLRKRLFERFYRAHGNSYRSGLGLGLYIARSIVEAHGGTISATFPEDGGSLFSVRLPLRPPAGESRG